MSFVVTTCWTYTRTIDKVIYLRNLIKTGLNIEDICKLHEKYIDIARKELYLNSQVKKVQRVFKRCISDPSHPFCQRRLIREFKVLTN